MYLYPVTFIRGWMLGEVSSTEAVRKILLADTVAGEATINIHNIDRNIFLNFIDTFLLSFMLV